MPAAKKAVPVRRSARPAKPRTVASRKPAVASSAPASKPVATAAKSKPEKPRKTKLLRDSFTIPKTEYAVIDALKQRAARGGRPAKKSEVLRAGIKALAVMGDTAFLAALHAVPAIKTGRPAKS